MTEGVCVTTEANIERVYHMVMYDSWLTINEIDNAISIFHETVENILRNELA